MLNDLTSQFKGSVLTMRRFFQRPIKLEQGNVRLGQTPTAQRATEQKEERRAERRSVRAMRRDLRELLDRHPDSRRLMRHIEAVERRLRATDFAAVDALPGPVIAKALQQLEVLVRDWSQDGLAELRSRLSMIVRNRPADEPGVEAAFDPIDEASLGSLGALERGLSTYDVEEVTDIDHAAFEEMERSWAGRMPAAAAAPVTTSGASTG